MTTTTPELGGTVYTRDRAIRTAVGDMYLQLLRAAELRTFFYLRFVSSCLLWPHTACGKTVNSDIRTTSLVIQTLFLRCLPYPKSARPESV